MVRFRPFQNVGLVQLRDEVDRLMDECLGTHLPGSKQFHPPVNVWEQEGEFVTEVEVPGYRQEDVEISIIGAELTVKGKRPEPTPESIAFLRRERTDHEFARSLRLPVEIDVEKVTATMEHGVLRVTLPKAPSVRARKIEVKRS